MPNMMYPITHRVGAWRMPNPARKGGKNLTRRFDKFASAGDDSGRTGECLTSVRAANGSALNLTVKK